MELVEEGSSQLITEHYNLQNSSLQPTLTVSPDVERVLGPGEDTQQDEDQAEAEHDHGEATAESHLGPRLGFVMS